LLYVLSELTCAATTPKLLKIIQIIGLKETL